MAQMAQASNPNLELRIVSTRTHAYHYRLTEDAEDEILAKKEARKMLTDKALCTAHNVSRSTLRQALQRARARRSAKTPEQND